MVRGTLFNVVNYEVALNWFVLGLSLRYYLAFFIDMPPFNDSLDVGGGSVSNKTRHSLARIALRWMVRECFKANTGIMFQSDELREIGLDPSTLYPHVLRRPPPLPVGEHRIQNLPATPIPIRTHKYLTKKHQHDIHEQVVETKIPFLGSEEEEEVRDAVCPKYDQLRVKKGWWFLELLPLRLRYQRSDNKWITTWGYVPLSVIIS